MIVVLGGSGYVGSAFCDALRDRDARWISLSRSQVSYYDRSELSAFLKDSKASFVINAAGFVGTPNVDECEIRRAECLEGNAVLPGVISEVCQDLEIPWGHISSGCIYDGPSTEKGFTEEDPPNFCFTERPCSFYSGTKALGEEIIARDPSCYVWRLRIPFDRFDSHRNYLTKLQRYERLLDVRNSLSHRGDFVAACLYAWENRVPFGVYNMTNSGSVTTREVTAELEKRGLGKKSFSFFSSIEEFYETAAVAPRSNCVLDNSKALAVGIPLRPVGDALAESLNSWSAL